MDHAEVEVEGRIQGEQDLEGMVQPELAREPPLQIAVGEALQVFIDLYSLISIINRL